MGFIEELKGGVAAFDTNCLIYYIERHPDYYPLVKSLFQAIENGNLRAITSAITLTEVLTLPFRSKRTELVKKYHQILTNTENIELLPIDTVIARQAAILRAGYSQLRTPDALQLSAAIFAKADAFIGNDFRLKGIREIPVIILKNYL